MDLQAIKSRLSSLNNNGRQEERVDTSAFFWRPELGKHTIRVVPSAFNPSYPFTELKFHYGIGKYPMIALSNFGKQDPIEEFVKELRKTNDKDNWSLSGKLNPKTRIFLPVIVRGEEDKGVRLWGFGITIYKALLALAEDEDVGDFTDVMNGWDLVVEQVQGNPYPSTTVRIKPKQTPLSDNDVQAEDWMKNQPNPLECFTPYDYNFIKKQLQAYLDPNAEESTQPPAGAEPAVEATSTPAPAPAQSYSLDTSAGTKKNTLTEFDDLFN
jgi:hypothetical protein